MKLNLLVLRVGDLEQSRSFYESLGLRFTREQHGIGPVHYACELNGIVLELYLQSTGVACAKLRLGFTVTSLEEVIISANSKGFEVRSDRTDPLGNRVAVIVDPDGNRIELRQQEHC